MLKVAVPVNALVLEFAMVHPKAARTSVFGVVVVKLDARKVGLVANLLVRR